MIYFLTFTEGGKFLRIERKISMRPKDRALVFEGEKCVAVFKCGIIYDSFASKYIKSRWRHKLLGGRRAGKKLYKTLLKLNLPHERVIGK